MRIVTLPVKGLNFAGCARAIEKHLSKQEPIAQVEASYVLQTVTVTYDETRLDETGLREMVKDCGFACGEPLTRFPGPGATGPLRAEAAHAHGTTRHPSMEDRAAAAHEKMDMGIVDHRTMGHDMSDPAMARAMEAEMRTHFFVSLVLTIPIILYAPLGTSLFRVHLPTPFGISPNWVLLVLATPVVWWGGWIFHSGAWRALRNRTLDMNVLVSLGVLVAYCFSVFVTVFAPQIETSYDASAMLVTFVLFGHWMEMRSRRGSSDALGDLLRLAPAQANVIRPTGEVETVPVAQVQVGDLLLLRPGEKVPVDGLVTEGESSIDEGMVTGESIPVSKQPGDEVIVPVYTFTASAEVIIYFRARPVFVDVDPVTCNLNPVRLEKCITPRTRAIIVVHIAGLPAEMDSILSIARAHNLPVIEDAAHAFPTRYRGRMIGSMGDLTAFSFYATKTLSTGEGGMLTTANAEYAERASMQSLHGISRDAWKRYSAEGSWYYEVIQAGYKYNMTDIAAALGLHQLARCDWLLERRQTIAKRYTEVFSQWPELVTPPDPPHVEHAWHLYMLRLQLDRLTITRDAFIQELARANIGTSVHFIPLHLHPFYRETCQLVPGDFPVALDIYQRVISLPIYPGMSDDDVEDVIAAIGRIIETYKK